MAWVVDHWQLIVGGATIVGALAAVLALLRGGDRIKAREGGVAIKGKGNTVHAPPKDKPE